MAEALEPLRELVHRVKNSVSRHRITDRGLRVLRESKNPEIDIVAVHGLGGEGFSSWITWDPNRSSKPKPWLDELLAQDVPNARIMTYGYMSDGPNYRYLVRNVLYGRALDLVKELANQRRQDDTARRPLFFIAHSLGGWIVKRALIISSEAADPELKDIELSTCGVAFFGTLSPGRPTSPSPLAHVIRRTSGFDDYLKRSSAPRSLRLRGRSMTSSLPQDGDVEWLESQLQAFKAITANLPRLSFYETKESTDGFIVDKGNSMSGSDGVQIGLKATHSDLVKFQGRDANYRTFIDRFREMMDKAKTSGILEAKQKTFDFAAVHRLEYLSSRFDIPYTLPYEIENIVPRERLLALLEAALDPPSGSASLQVSIVNLWGPTGIGKTTLARHYAELHRDDISFVFWVYAESWETVITSYLEFADSLVTHYAGEVSRERVESDLGFTGVGEMLKVKNMFQLESLRVKSIVRAVKDWLMRPENDKWLVVFDNIEPSLDVFDFIPLTLTGKVILTSRDRSAAPWGTELEVTVMTEQESLDLMGNALGSESVGHSFDAEASAKIAKHLGYHPRSLAMTSATIRYKGGRASDYLAMLDAKSSLVTFGSNVDQSRLTKTVLRISAMLSPSMIPIALFTSTTQSHNIPERFTSVFEDMKLFQDLGHLDNVLEHLIDQDMIQTPSLVSSPTSSQSSSSSFESFILEPEVRDHVRTSLSSGEQADNAWLACHVCVDGIKEKELESGTLREIQDFGRIMGPHAKTCYEDWSTLLERQKGEDVAWHVLGNVCMAQGALGQAIGCFELSLKHGDQLDAIERVQVSLSLASILTHEGQHQRSEEVLNAIDIPSVDQALSFKVAMARASAAAASGELDDAESRFEILEQEQELALGPTDINTVTTVQRLASTLEQLGRLEESRALYRRVYISYQNLFGQAHPLTLEALEDLAHVSRLNNAIDDAESLYKQSVDVKTRTLGAQHPSTAHALQKLAVIDDLRCRYDAARLKYQRTLDILSRTLGRAHPLYITAMENMALSARLEGHSLDQPDSPVDPTYDQPPHRTRSLTTSKSPSFRASSALPSTSASISAIMLDTRRRTAFHTAEKLYLDVLDVKRAAREIFTEDQVLVTGSMLREMYENEDFFDGVRTAKIESLMGLLREGRRRGTV